MEVSSSTSTSSLQDETTSYTSPSHSAATATSSLVPTTVVSTSNSSEVDERNNTASTKEVAVMEGPVRYGPSLPPAFYHPESVSFSKDVRDPKALAGSCGLYNLGNTCFMNAGLQSLMSCAPLVKFFCENYTLTDGNKHTLTGHFYMLLCKVWSGHFSILHPRKFKEILGLNHSQFEDYRQHDCQEFLALLLDTLHEQLNIAQAASKHSFLSSVSCGVASSSCSQVSAGPSTGSYVSTSSASKLGPVTSSDADDLLTQDLNNLGSSPQDHLSYEVAEVKDSSTAKSPRLVNVSQLVLAGSRSNQSTEYTSQGSPSSELSLLDSTMSPSDDSDVVCQASLQPQHALDADSFSPLKVYKSRSNLNDVTSSDGGGVGSKPSLKRTSSGSSVTACGPSFYSEDSNHSSLSAHSTDSEQSTAFKRLKIDSMDINRNSNNILKDCVTSSSDCSKNALNKKNMLQDNALKRRVGETLSSHNHRHIAPSHTNLNIIDNIVSSCQDSSLSEVAEALSPSSPGLPSLEDFYSKETKTLNTNVVSDFLQEITSDSEKFAKVDNRYRPPSKEVNLLQEALGEEDKAEKVLIGHRFGGIKETNLYVHSASTVKPSKHSDSTIMLNNSRNVEALALGTAVKLATNAALEAGNSSMLPAKLYPDASKLDEEKNIQMQAYSKFNTIPDRSNIRTDLIDVDPDQDMMDVDEVELGSSDEDDVEVASHTSTVEECSSLPNYPRQNSPAEVLMANKAWDDYLAKNDSVIVSTFQGQFRSTVVCSECSHVSITYEPFMYLSLPIPHAMEQQLCVVYVCQQRPPIKYLLNLFKTDKIGTAKNKLAELVGLSEPGNIIMAEVLDSHISRILDNNIQLRYLNTNTRKIYAFEVVSIDPEDGMSWSSPAQRHMLNNEDSSCLPSFEIPSSSQPLPYASHNHSSNHSFDSVVVNSPSSRDTLDYVTSETEGCEPISGSVSEDQDIHQQLDSDSMEDQRDSSISSSKHITTSSGQASCSSSRCFPIQNTGLNAACSESKDQESEEEEAMVSEGCSSQMDLFSSPSPLLVKRASSATCLVEEEEVNILGCSDSGVTSSTTRNNHSNDSDDEDSCTNSCGRRRNLSRSCPSPEIVPHLPSHITSLMDDVAARLQSATASFLPLHSKDDRYRASQSQGFGGEYSANNSGNSLGLNMGLRGNGSGSSRWQPLIPRNSPPDTFKQSTDSGTDNLTCAICLEDLSESELVSHYNCNGVYCYTCLEMSLKHAADASNFCCPTCLQPASINEDFHPLKSSTGTKPRTRTVALSIAYRHRVSHSSGSSSLQLFGHPHIIHTPSSLPGLQLYSLVDHLLSPLHAVVYSLVLTGGQGLACSRCPFSWGCTGCEVARDGEVTLQPSDCLTVNIRNNLSSVDLASLQAVLDDVTMTELRSTEPITIMDCFEAFTQSEILDEHNPWYCPQCEKNQCAKKTMTVWRYPDNLIIHLKRFMYQDLSSTKIDNKVIFPYAGMDVRGHLSGPSSHDLVYDLYGIVCHFGGASAGHYTCFSKHPLASQWFYYNDETVTAQAPSDSEYAGAYVLFYQRQGTAVDFRPSQTLPCFEEGMVDSGVCSFNTSSGGNHSMALVLYQPTPEQRPKVGDDSGDSTKGQQSRDGHTSLGPHFWSSMADSLDKVKAGVGAGGDNQADTNEPDSTLDFYS